MKILLKMDFHHNLDKPIYVYQYLNILSKQLKNWDNTVELIPATNLYVPLR